MSYLNWISDEDLETEVNKVFQKALGAKEIASTKLDRNVIDPFSIFFEMSGFDIPTVDMWRVSEEARQAQKSLSNSFGIFHQSVLGCVEGWEDLGTGHVVDLLSKKNKIIAEVKNKYSTVKGSDQYTVYDSLEGLVMPKTSMYYGYKAYYVEIIPKQKRKAPQKYDVPFTPSVKETGKQRAANELIRKIDGQSFYSLVTGEKDALKDLYLVLPEVIKNVSDVEFSEEAKKGMLEYFKKAFVG